MGNLDLDAFYRKRRHGSGGSYEAAGKVYGAAGIQTTPRPSSLIGLLYRS